MKRAGLLLLLLAGCHRDRDLKLCEYNPCYCTDASAEAEAATADADDEVATDAESDGGCTTKECTPGEIATVTGSCPGALEKKTKTCTSSCTWGPEVCALPKGWTLVPDAPIDGRVQASAVWTGGELIVYGGGRHLDGEPAMKDGAVYSLLKNSWTELPTPAISTAARKRHAAVWTGFEMIVWGGMDGATIRGDGMTYSAFDKIWSSIASAPIAARMRAGSVWIPTAKKMFVWGGDDGSTRYADGALYDPNTSSWTKLPGAPISARVAPEVGWTGTEVLVWGGFADAALTDGALYNPTTNSWRTIPAAPIAGRVFSSAGMVGDRFVMFGGAPIGGAVLWDGAMLSLDPTPTWTTVAAPGASVLSQRQFPQSWANSNCLAIWGGADASGSTYLADGAFFDPATGSWSAIDGKGAPTARFYGTSVWTGAAAMIWSGYTNPGGGIAELAKDGGLFVP